MKYKVIALSVGGLGNKVFKLGDEVADENFPNGNGSLLEKKGFLKATGKKTEVENENDDDNKEATPYKDITANEIRELLSIDKEGKLSKKELYEEYLKTL